MGRGPRAESYLGSYRCRARHDPPVGMTRFSASNSPRPDLPHSVSHLIQLVVPKEAPNWPKVDLTHRGWRDPNWSACLNQRLGSKRSSPMPY